MNYVLGDGDDAVRLPDSYSGLGFKNLIYMVVEILDVHQGWREEKERRAPLHLIFVEEPETHLHAQLQQVFVRKVLGLLDGADGPFASQVVVTTHSRAYEVPQLQRWLNVHNRAVGLCNPGLLSHLPCECMD